MQSPDGDACSKMIGHPLHSGREFQQVLEDGPLSGGCVREVLGGQQVFRFSDASVWSISSHEIPVGRRTCILFTADDVAGAVERGDAPGSAK